jgi:membrane protein YqaA with SNARE-associated domain
MIGTLLATLGVGFVSAFFPGLPAEPYLIAVVASTSTNSAALALATAIGQSAGKLVMFLAARGTLRTPLVSRWITKQREKLSRRVAGNVAESPGRLRRAVAWLRNLAPKDSNTVNVPILLLSAFVGIPPLLLMTLTASASKMRTVVFVATCLTGRSARMLVIAIIPGVLILHG